MDGLVFSKVWYKNSPVSRLEDAKLATRPVSRRCDLQAGTVIGRDYSPNPPSGEKKVWCPHHLVNMHHDIWPDVVVMNLHPSNNAMAQS